MTFKPMLASAIKDTSKLTFPVLVSIKLDGIRATVQGGRLLSRTLKPIPNKHVQEMFAGLPEGLDGELIYGDPGHPDCFRNTTSIVMSDDKKAAGVQFHVFDIFTNGPFTKRDAEVCESLYHLPAVEVVYVTQKLIHGEEELLQFEATALEHGHEGVMVRSLTGRYKQGRSTVNEGILLKLKRFVDSEAEIIGVYELMHNSNEAKKNLLGRTERSTAKDGMVGTGVLGGFNVRDLESGVEFEIGTGFDGADADGGERHKLWDSRKKLIGNIIKYKFFPTGSKDRPRFPVFLGFRDKRDM